jgi:Kef-type K+ transport system membrane component KefB
VVQIETLGEFGVFLILFSLGLEFSPERIKKVNVHTYCILQSWLDLIGGGGGGGIICTSPENCYPAVPLDGFKSQS